MKSLPQTTSGRTGGKPAAMAKPETGRRPVKRDAGKPLSNLQKATISQTARQAFIVQDRAGLVDATGSETARLAEWRHRQQLAAGCPASLRDCGNNHYRSLMAHFLCLAGKDDTAFRYQLKTGRVKDRGAEEDTHENRETQRRLIVQALLEHGRRCEPQAKEYDPALAATVAENGGIITQGYVVNIAKMKNKGKSLDSLTATDLAQILYTIRNRIAAKEGRGKPARRNKKQTAASAIERRREDAIARGDWSEKKQRDFEKRMAAKAAKKGGAV